MIDMLSRLCHPNQSIVIKMIILSLFGAGMGNDDAAKMVSEWGCNNVILGEYIHDGDNDDEYVDIDDNNDDNNDDSDKDNDTSTGIVRLGVEIL